jgi:DNA-binding transcriptional ArsR family regulator
VATRCASSRRSSARLDEIAGVFSALGDPTRLRLVSKLSDGEARSITELSKGAGISRQAVTKHLRVLRDSDLVSRRSVGRETRFLLNPEPFEDLKDYMGFVSERWDESLARLRNFVENAPD